MPNEPEREIEKVLKSYANRRRDEAGAPRPMHPATRKMLRDEALRAHVRGRQSRGWSLFSWPGLAYGVSMIVGVGLAAWLMFPRTVQKVEYSLAMNRPQQPASAVFKSVPQRAPKAPADFEDAQNRRGQNSASDMYKDKHGDASGATRSLAKGDSDRKAPASNPGNAGFSNFDDAKEKPTLLAGATVDLITNNAPVETPAPTAVAFSEPPPPAALPTVATASAGSVADVPMIAKTDSIERVAGGGGFGGASSIGETVVVNKSAKSLSEQFTRVNTFDASSVAKKKPDAPGVLKLFRVDQNQQQIRVIDSDGSVYDGFVIQPAMETKTEGASASDGRLRDLTFSEKDASNHLYAPPAAGPVHAGIPSVQNIIFRVSGTNRSLNESVVFTGTWLAGTEHQPAAPAPSGSVSGVTKFGMSLTPVQTSVGHLTGRAIVGGTNQFEINAEAKP